MGRQVDQAGRLEFLDRDQLVVIGLQVGIDDVLRLQQLDPFAVRRVGHHVGVAAVAGEGHVVGGDIEVHAPFVGLEAFPHAPAGGQLQAGHPEYLAARCLQVVPQPLRACAWNCPSAASTKSTSVGPANRSARVRVLDPASLPRRLQAKIDGGSATVLELPLERAKTLERLELRTLANDVVIGLMGVTLD